MKYNFTSIRPYFLDEESIVFDWMETDIGYGSIEIQIENGEFVIDSENMSKEFIKAVLNKLIDDAQLML